MAKVLRLIIIAVLFVGLIAAFKEFLFLENSPVLGTESASPEVPTNREQEITFNGGVYLISWQKVDPEKIILLPNFSDKKTASTLFDEFDCKTLINGGFYSKAGEDNSPIGLFVSNGQPLSRFQENKTYNGTLSINALDTPRITSTMPEDILRDAMQTGPILIENGSPREISLQRDKFSRRMVAAITGDNELLFISVHKEGFSFDGPKLLDMPMIISQFSSENKLNIADAINLDGGSASAFYSLEKEISLSEASPIGSFFCEK